MLSLCCRNQNTLFRFYLLCGRSFTLTSDKFRMVYKVDENPQLDSCDWRMYSSILKKPPLITFVQCIWNCVVRWGYSVHWQDNNEHKRGGHVTINHQMLASVMPVFSS